ncbi:MAG TPA: hypothetical protein VFY73_02470 [Ideonella sp.]|uniref:hypothetical protein n=1 Tax=Ideonella sp. TaxID=1929293 RepID=UPI002E346470|nr:hypothetical protein [Ideonella sp.]HEX5682875.1 hypothetical protein [Ideonella sp.]
MDANNVPQEGNATLGGQRKAIYARDENGKLTIVASRGWEVEEIVTRQAVDAMAQQAEVSRERVLAGLASPLEYWMHAQRMDVALLAQSSGFWQWRVRRHLKPQGFSRLSEAQLGRYAQALGLATAALRKLP